MTPSWKTACLGASWGVLLVLLAFPLSGGGQVRYLFRGTSSAPVGLLGYLLALVAGPLVWSCLSWLAPQTGNPQRRALFLFAVLLHYVGVLCIVVSPHYNNWAYLVECVESLPLLASTWCIA